MATKVITSEQSGPRLPGATTPLFIKTQSVFTPDVNGNPIADRPIVTKLLFTPNGSDFFVAAESTKGGAPGSWVLKKYTPDEIFNAGITQFAQPDGTVLGPTAALSLNTQNGIIYQAAQNSIKKSATSAGIPVAFQKPLASSLQNTATNNSDNTDTGDNADNGDDEPEAPKPAANSAIENLKIDSSPGEGTIRTRLSNIQAMYPETIDTKVQDIIMFRLKEIIGRKFGTGEEQDPKKSQFSFGSKSLGPPFGSVILPIQPSITDSNGVEWGGANLDPLSAYAGKAALSITTTNRDIGTATLDALKAAGNAFKSNFSDYATFINLYFAQEAVGATGLLSRATGAVLNPNLELLFSGPTLRTFSFTFKLSPRSSSEAKMVKDIIFFFKAGMAVRKANTGVFLKAPYVFSIKYMSAGGSHKSLNKIKDCALLNCDVDYTPDGSYMTFTDEEKTLTSYQLTLRFSELDPIYNEDYADPEDPNHPIGY